MQETSILGFTGAFQDPVTAGYPLGSGYRWFLPTLMRFNAPDDASPFGPGGPNSYAYCSGDPINLSDPTGHMPSVTGLDKDVEELMDIGHDLTQADSSIAAAAAAPKTSVAANSTEDQAAVAIQRWWRGWRKHYDETSRDVETISALVSSMGKPVKSLDEFKRSVLTKRVLVQANGTLGMLDGHAVFYFDDSSHELLLRSADTATNHPYRAKKPTLHTYGWMRGKPDQHAFIHTEEKISQYFDEKYFDQKIGHLINKGNTHLLDEKYSEHFERALRQERFSFMHQPYSYGWHYNCQTFARSVLQRLSDMTP